MAKVTANFWVIATGSDCDGYNSGRVSSFIFSDDAFNYADDQNEWSDGIRYQVIDSLDTLKSYCDDYMIDWTSYVFVEQRLTDEV